MRSLLHTEFAALLARAGVSQASFARLTGLTSRQVNNWCRGRAAVPPWAVALAVLLEERSPEAITMLLEETSFAWHERSVCSPAPRWTPSASPCADSPFATTPIKAVQGS